MWVWTLVNRVLTTSWQSWWNWGRTPFLRNYLVVEGLLLPLVLADQIHYSTLDKEIGLWPTRTKENKNKDTRHDLLLPIKSVMSIQTSSKTLLSPPSNSVKLGRNPWILRLSGGHNVEKCASTKLKDLNYSRMPNSESRVNYTTIMQAQALCMKGSERLSLVFYSKQFHTL